MIINNEPKTLKEHFKKWIAKSVWDWLRSSGATNFPGSLDSYSTKSSGDTISEAHINDPQDAIEATEAKIGTGASTPTVNKILSGTGVGTSAWGDALDTLEDYATSASTGTARALGALIIHYGAVSITTGASQAITNLNFTNNTSYTVLTSPGIAGSSDTGTANIVKDSGAQFTITNSDGATVIVNWLAIGI